MKQPSRFNNIGELNNWLDSIESKHHDFDIINVKKAYKKIGSPCSKKQVFHIAGTNGKGSVCNYLYQALLENNKFVGIYTSPHIVKINERIQFNSQTISDIEFVHFANKLLKALGKYITILTQFEIFTLIALLCLEENCDFVVLETGLGGRLDATNIVPSKIQVITNISLEHTVFLGDTREKILEEKIGIIKENSKVICGIRDMKLQKILINKCKDLNCELKLLGRDFLLDIIDGTYKDENKQIAKQTLKAVENKFSLDKEKINSGIEKTVLKGRLDLIKRDGKQILIDSAHNPDGLFTLSESINSLGFKPDIVLCAISFDKDKNKMAELISSFAKRIVITKSNYRYLEPKEFAECFNKEKNEIRTFENPKEALEYCLKQADNMLVCGSIYLLEKIYVNLESST